MKEEMIERLKEYLFLLKSIEEDHMLDFVDEKYDEYKELIKEYKENENIPTRKN